MNWMSVKDKLPSTATEVLIYDDCNEIWIAVFGKSCWDVKNPSCECCYDAWEEHEVTHWMELPEPPKSSEEE